MNIKFPPDIHEDESKSWNLDSLMLLFFSGTNSLVLTMDNSNYITALDVAHKANAATA